MITRTEYMMGRDTEYPTTEDLEVATARLLYRVNRLVSEFRKVTQPHGWVAKVNSGYRPGKYNVSAGGSPRSAHLTCEAVDIGDPMGALGKWILSHPQVLVTYDLYMEDPTRTPSWVHLQTRKTGSGRRVFMP